MCKRMSQDQQNTLKYGVECDGEQMPLSSVLMRQTQSARQLYEIRITEL